MPSNFQSNINVCVLVVNSGLSFWVKSLFKAKFVSYPGLRLYGTVSDTRLATNQEQDQLQHRIGAAKFLKGSSQIWYGLNTVRDITFTSVVPVAYPKMMDHLQ